MKELILFIISTASAFCAYLWIDYHENKAKKERNKLEKEVEKQFKKGFLK